MTDNPPVISTSRLEAFSDGVFAIAITLLVIEIHLPEGWEHDLRGALISLWPSYVAYAITFLLVGMVWMNHHRMFHFIRRTDGVLLGLNVLLLMDVAFLPFPTHVLAEALHSGDGAAQRVAAVFYGLVLVVGGIFYNAVWWYASLGHRHLGPHITPPEARALRLRWGLGPVSYLVPTVIGAFSAVAALCCYVFLLVVFCFDMRPRRRDALSS
ncbi:TMEM175 family protein [Nonomuraea roseoviolacea]|uniref:Membrane protein n=1 Tax=Nonomuraea roseoviolacea subsp. carminata TaxID=160689 RepID=A0ABT1K2I5_9ACTN|nr:TMEM175 family protein [Nonomuraea roseoviolacea]MCP2348206.1 putative membrane protein [Nonomuraea roseoviolacea subsp. carminata]